MKRGISSVVIFFSVCFLHGCSIDLPTPVLRKTGAPPGGRSFQEDVKPLLNQHGCPVCHGGTAGLTVTTVSDLLLGGDHGPAIVPGNADSSHLVQKVSPFPPFGDRMPLGGPYLTPEEIQLIRDWIAQGAKDN